MNDESIRIRPGDPGDPLAGAPDPTAGPQQRRRARRGRLRPRRARRSGSGLGSSKSKRSGVSIPEVWASRSSMVTGTLTGEVHGSRNRRAGTGSEPASGGGGEGEGRVPVCRLRLRHQHLRHASALPDVRHGVMGALQWTFGPGGQTVSAPIRFYRPNSFVISPQTVTPRTSDGEHEDHEERPEAGVRHPGRAAVLDLRVPPGAVEVVRPVDGRRVDRRRLDTRPLGRAPPVCRLGHGPKCRAIWPDFSRLAYAFRSNGRFSRPSSPARPH